MYFSKSPYPSNFEFVTGPAGKPFTVGGIEIEPKVDSFEGDIYRIRLTSDSLWEREINLVPLTPPDHAKNTNLQVGAGLHLTLRNKKGDIVLESQPDMAFGVMGHAHVFCFRYHRAQQFFGFGEKTFPTFELSHKRTKYWNTDVLGDFPGEQWWQNTADPYYVAVPYMIVRTGDDYVGLLLHNPCAPFMDTGSDASFFGTLDENRRIVLGAEDECPDLWIILGPSLPELTSKLQSLVGKTPIPPLWALGYHQCRWGYKGEKELAELDAKMAEHQIPNDGLWLDIDYLDGYRVFTYAKEHFPSGVAKGIQKGGGRKVVPIIDPGVKIDTRYEVYQSGLKAGVFCQNPQGKEYVGMVWPGLTVYPDFTMPEGRAWWAKYAKEFKQQGFAGAWLDMNDPSTGAVDPHAMLFRRGHHPHMHFRNQYALGMQMATREGFEAASPNERIFLLSRSGYVGTSRYSALWTGDNCSNYWYLAGSIPQSLNLGLSGIPFHGNDVGGFMNDTNGPLLEDWTKTCFLFPFFRIHSVHFNRPQEPWSFTKGTLESVRKFIRFRYALLPYLYQLFIEQNRDGHPITRPLLYHYPAKSAIGDQFLVGTDILQAPFVAENASERVVTLPGNKAWFDLFAQAWVRPGKRKVTKARATTPLYIRDGAIIPVHQGDPASNQVNLRKVEFFAFTNCANGQTRYVFDDGESMDYAKGKQSEVIINLTRREGTVSIKTEVLSAGYGALTASLSIVGDVRRVLLNGKPVRTKKCRQAFGPVRLSVTRLDLALD